ncbi:hypothetical protein K443DRAFT_678108 [Laccaria amethystina LaAM-08-1]|uniref:Uncharacterized protein n=1 Tax=Laccaria amethystina LaAM-08-1 TaxID=1095629 RepID=A0A0C9XA40_9AGAR|nr:hypothetical protein K443DRAFT_678108 [Laccaria amethystina LaAM-08-1]
MKTATPSDKALWETRAVLRLDRINRFAENERAGIPTPAACLVRASLPCLPCPSPTGRLTDRLARPGTSLSLFPHAFPTFTPRNSLFA